MTEQQEPPKRRGRRPEGERAMTPAERQARRRALMRTRIDDAREQAWRAAELERREAEDAVEKAQAADDKIVELIATIPERLLNVAKAAAAGEPHEDVDVLFAEHRRVMQLKEQTRTIYRQACARRRAAWDALERIERKMRQ